MSLKLFFSYAHEDESFKVELDEHLAALKYQGLISEWHDRKIVPGQEWDKQISTHLEDAQIIVLLISSKFLSSEYCRELEMTRALEKHEAREAIVIPVVIKPALLKGLPFMKLQALPKDCLPVTKWPSRDEAWTNVAEGIQRACKRMLQSEVVGAGDSVESGRAHLESHVSIPKIREIRSETSAEHAAGMAGNQLPEDLDNIQESMDELLQRMKALEKSGHAIKDVEIDGQHISRTDILLKKAILLRSEADQMLLNEGSGKHFNEAYYMAKLQEAHKLLLDANQNEPTNTEVLLEMAKLLIELTPDDPTDEEALLYKLKNLIDDPRDKHEEFRLAQATFLLATSRVPYQKAELKRAKKMFKKLGRDEWVEQCDLLMPRAASGGNGRMADAYRSDTDEGMHSPPPPIVFNPIGNWQIKIGDYYNSTMSMTLFANGSFQGTQFFSGMQAQSSGNWHYNPLNKLLQFQGMVNGFQPFALGISLHGPQENGFYGIGTDGFGYWLYPQ